MMLSTYTARRGPLCVALRQARQTFNVVQHIAGLQALEGKRGLSQERVSTLGWKSEKITRHARQIATATAAASNPPARDLQPESDSPPRRFENGIRMAIDGVEREFSPLLLRDSCTCPKCVDVSTRQKLFSTVDIPAHIKGDFSRTNQGVDIRWTNDLEGHGCDHVTHFSNEALQSIAMYGSFSAPMSMPSRVLWDDQRFRRDIQDISYASYMSNEHTLLTALEQLHTHGLLFLTGVPETESSVSAIAERIGPLKNTFYGMTWDVRSVPQAKNVAYTSQDLGFHMDLLYMKQPPHLQFLHCIRSSSAGGSSTFTDSLKAAADLFRHHQDAFVALQGLPVDFHYDHPNSNYYRQTRSVIEPRRLVTQGNDHHSIGAMLRYISARSPTGHKVDHTNISDWIDAISWAPPFQAPFSLHPTGASYGKVPNFVLDDDSNRGPRLLGNRIHDWYIAAHWFNKMIHRPEGIHERMMKPSECVIFDNRRVLHARRAFEVGDVGKERWLRGAYLDKDPYISKLKVLQNRLIGARKDNPATS